MIFRHDANTIGYIWAKAIPLLSKALEYNYDGLTLDEILDSILGGYGGLWVVEENNAIKIAVYTEVMQRKDGKRKVKLSLVAGNGLDKEIMELHAKIAEWGKEKNCIEMEGSGREGWRKFAKLMGYHHVYSTYRKGL